jgi:hypothetical protein
VPAATDVPKQDAARHCTGRTWRQKLTLSRTKWFEATTRSFLCPRHSGTQKTPRLYEGRGAWLNGSLTRYTLTSEREVVLYRARTIAAIQTGLRI